MSTIFPKWTNHLPTALGLGTLGGLGLVIGVVWYYFTPKFWEVGYMPAQPGLTTSQLSVLVGEGMQIPGRDFPGFSHKIHVGKLGMDCRYCHTHVEESAEANIPNVATCIGCHADQRLSSVIEGVIGKRVAFLRQAYDAGTRYEEYRALLASGKDDEAESKLREWSARGLEVVEGGASIEWRRVHKLPDYVRNFPHHVHVAAGVSCYSCHGLVAMMPVVHQMHSLSMSWCLDCHRNPTPNLVPPDRVTNLFWASERLADAPAQQRAGAELLRGLQSSPLHLLPENCGACHY